MTDSSDDELSQHAAQWLRTLESCGPEERRQFAKWIKQSPRHVRAMLLLASWNSIPPQYTYDAETPVEH